MKIINILLIILTFLTIAALAAETTWRHSGFEVAGYDFNFSSTYSINKALNVNGTTANFTNYNTSTGKQLANIVGMCSYLITNESGTINAYNCTTWKKDYSGTNATAIFESVNGDIYITPGTYSFSTVPTVINSSIRFSGAGAGITILTKSDSSMSRILRFEGVNNVSVKGITFIGGELYFNNSNDIIISENSVLDSTNYGIWIRLAKNVTVRNNRIDNTTVEAGIDFRGVSKSLIINNNVANTKLECIVVNSDTGLLSNNNIILGNIVSKCGNDGISVVGQTQTLVKSIIVSENQVSDVTLGPAISVYQTENFTVSGNILDPIQASTSNNNAGISLGVTSGYPNTSGGLISGNQILSGSEGIISKSNLTNTLIVGNKINNIYRSGIYLYTPSVYTNYSNVSIISNTITNFAYGTAGVGIDCDACKYSTIFGNTIEDTRGITGDSGIIEAQARSIGNIIRENVIRNMDTVSSYISASHSNYGESGYNWGACSSVSSITPFGTGDSCSNTTTGLLNSYNGTAWIYQNGTAV